MSHRVIHIHSQAPPKPGWGEACNGCGVCCLLQPCPVGVLVSRRRHGACTALVWQQAEGRYLCGILATPRRYTGLVWPWAQKVAARLTRRMISAGRGCDCDVEPEAEVEQKTG
ncbi:MAG: hypothetical protein OEM00_01980 [Burkholderiaceae bacterium]|nr:hypothetical protein [Burkholderiaceae bacterium]MDH3459745.1 hypothetical protein [Burkholderiaceae bacterium]